LSGRAELILGAQVVSQHGIAAVIAGSGPTLTQQVKQSAPSGAAENANARRSTTANRCT
jgi:hypothetical protein